jgi:hypothetical protein
VGLTAPPCKNPVVRKSKEAYGPYRAVLPKVIMNIILIIIIIVTVTVIIIVTEESKTPFSCSKFT